MRYDGSGLGWGSLTGECSAGCVVLCLRARWGLVAQFPAPLTGALYSPGSMSDHPARLTPPTPPGV